MALVIAVATITHVVPLLVFRHPSGLFITDINDYRIVADALLNRQDAYVPRSYLFIHPYLPLHMYVLALADWASGRLHVDFFVLVRIPQVAADVGIAAVICRASRDLTGDENVGFRNGLSYAVCPFPILVAVYHGQFDAVSVFFALTSWYIAVCRPQTLRSVVLSGFFLGLGILDKSWPIFLLPALLVQVRGIRSRLVYAVTCIGLVMSAIVFYLLAFSASLSLLITRTTKYVAPYNIDGHTLILDRLSDVFPQFVRAVQWDNDHGTAILFLTFAVVFLLELPRRKPLAASVAVLVAVLTATTNGGSYHYLWLVPFALLAHQRLLLSLLLVATAVRSSIIGFVGGGIYFGALVHPELQTLSDHAWAIGIVEWAVLLIWFARNMRDAVADRVISVESLSKVGLRLPGRGIGGGGR